MADADNTLEMIQSFLSSPDAKDKISEALSMLGSGNFPLPVKNEENKKSEDALDIDPQKLMSMMSLFKSLEAKSDPRSDLLTALKPYLSKDKRERADRAIKMVKILKYTPMLENLKDMFI